MSKVRIEVNYAGVGALLHSEEVAALVGKEASTRAAALGSGYASDIHQAGTRVIASVYTETPEAARDNMQNDSLLRAVSSG